MSRADFIGTKSWIIEDLSGWRGCIGFEGGLFNSTTWTFSFISQVEIPLRFVSQFPIFYPQNSLTCPSLWTVQLLMPTKNACCHHQPTIRLNHSILNITIIHSRLPKTLESPNHPTPNHLWNYVLALPTTENHLWCSQHVTNILYT